jgi:hypothetical protein
MFEVITLLTLMVKGVRLEQVQNAFNAFSNISDDQFETGCVIYRNIDSMGGRSVTAWKNAPKADQYSYTSEVLDLEMDRHGYQVQCWNAYWIKEVEFVSATSGSSIRWVADRGPIEGEADGAPGTFTFIQGTPGYFGSYFTTFNEVVGSLS